MLGITEQGKATTVTWYRDAPVTMPPTALHPSPPRSGLHPIAIVGIVIGCLFLFLIIVGSVGSGGKAPTSTSGNVAGNVAVSATAADSDYVTVDVRDLKKNPNDYKGKRIQIQGEVFNIMEDGGRTYMQIWVPTPGGSSFDREAVVVNYGNKLPNVYEKTMITVFGVGDGVSSGKNAFGALLSQPVIRADRVNTGTSASPSATSVATNATMALPTTGASLVASPQATSIQTAPSSAPQNGAELIGQTATAKGSLSSGTVQATVTDVKRGISLPGVSPGGELLVVFVKVTNTGNSATDVGRSSFTIVDSKGRQFTMPDDTKIQSGAEKQYGKKGTYASIQPSLSADLVLAFEIAPDATGLKLVPGR